MTNQQLTRLLTIVVSQNHQLIQMRQEKLSQIEGMLKWTRRIAIGAGTTGIGWIITMILKALGFA